MIPFDQLEILAAQLCHLSGGNWNRKRTKRALWRKRAAALYALAHGNEAEAKRIMRGGL